MSLPTNNMYNMQCTLVTCVLTVLSYLLSRFMNYDTTSYRLGYAGSMVHNFYMYLKYIFFGSIGSSSKIENLVSKFSQRVLELRHSL